MGEAGLGPAEVGKEIAEHRKHTMHQRADRAGPHHHDHRGRAARHGRAHGGLVGVRVREVEHRITSAARPGERGKNRGQPAGEVAARTRSSTRSTFNAWFGAYVAGNIKAMDDRRTSLPARVRGRVRRVDRHDPFNNDDAPPGPTYMPEYKLPGLEQGEGARHEGRRAPAEGAESAETADRYIRITVFLATVLFLVGMSSHFPLRVARYGLIGTAVVILLARGRVPRHLALAAVLTPCLRAYIARSARRRSVSSSSSGSDNATPTLTLNGIGTPSRSPRSSTAARIRSATSTASPGRPARRTARRTRHHRPSR